VKDVATILGLTLAGCLGVGLAGGLVLHLLRRRSFRHLLTIATLIPVVAVVVTVLINVRFMFLSAHDSAVVLIALGASLLLAVLAAAIVTRRLVQASRQVSEGLNLLVADTASPVPVSAPTDHPPELPSELARVISDLAETRRTLAESRERERAADSARRELVSFMSHDLRTPLAGLRALAEGLEDGVIVDQSRALAQMRGTVDRMSGLVDDLFALSRVQGPPQPKPETLVSLTELITDVAGGLTPSAVAHDVDLQLDIPSDDRLAVVGAPDDLTRAVTNLVANAIRHTEPGLRVLLLGRRTEGGGVQVAVIDGCGGIPEASLRRVFDTGWRGTLSRSGDDGGAGLGLAIAKGVVQSHAGEIAVHNVDGGCRFEVDLPALIDQRS
jgi:signal transduction histidine kinase